MKIENRFLLFDENGHFVDEVEFKDNMSDTTIKQPFNIQSDKEDCDEIPESERMILITMSKTNRYFIFYDRKLKTYKVYEIVI